MAPPPLSAAQTAATSGGQGNRMSGSLGFGSGKLNKKNIMINVDTKVKKCGKLIIHSPNLFTR